MNIPKTPDRHAASSIGQPHKQDGAGSAMTKEFKKDGNDDDGVS